MKDKQKKHRKPHILPDSIIMSIILLIGFFCQLVFLMFVLALDVLPIKYAAAVIGALLLIDIIAVLLLNSKKKLSAKPILGLIMVVLVANVLFVGDYYLYNTYDTLQKISKHKARWEMYDVIALNGGKYQTENDFDGETINTIAMQSKQLNEAKETLVTKAGVEYNEEPNLLSVGHHIMDENGETHDELILVTNSEYKVLRGAIEGFGENTNVIYKIKVKKRVNDSANRIDVTEESFNVLISGNDVWGSIDQEALSDVNMIMTVNPKTREILLTSIPRDSYIPLHTYGQRDKLTHSGIYGEEETKHTIEDFLGTQINYTLRVNFSMLVDIVNAIDGIDVYNDVDFISHPKHWHYKKGNLHLEGHRALWFARERKAFLEGDMKRNENQQKVLTAIIDKVSSSKVILTRYPKILNSVEDEMATDLTAQDLKKLAKMQLKDMNGWKISRVNIVGGTGMAPCYSMGNQNLSCVFPSEESVEDAKKKIHDVMYPVENNKKKNVPQDEQKDSEGKDKSTDSTKADNGSEGEK